MLREDGAAGSVTVNYATSNGTATSGASCTNGVDYLPASGTFTWNSGDVTVRQFTITLCNDGSNEDDETINLTLSNATDGYGRGTVTQIVVRLPDNVIGAPRDLRVKLILRGPGTDEAVISIAAP